MVNQMRRLSVPAMRRLKAAVNATEQPPVISEWRDEDPKLTLDRMDIHVGDKNVGYLTTHPATDGGVWIKGLKVDPEYRGRGYASQLLARALEKYQDQEISLRAKPYGDKPLNAEALKRFYKNYGFEAYDDEDRMRRMPKTSQETHMTPRLLQRATQAMRKAAAVADPTDARVQSALNTIWAADDDAPEFELGYDSGVYPLQSLEDVAAEYTRDLDGSLDPSVTYPRKAGPYGRASAGGPQMDYAAALANYIALTQKLRQTQTKTSFASRSLSKTAATALRRMIKLVPQPAKSADGWVNHSLTLGGKQIGRISGAHQPSGFRISYSEVDPKFQGMGLGKKMYGDLLKQLGGKPLLSDATVSPAAQRVWKSMANRPASYTVKTNPAAQIRPGATALADPTTIRMANSAASIKAKMSAPLWRRLLGMHKKPAAVPETQNNVFEAVLNRIGK